MPGEPTPVTPQLNEYERAVVYYTLPRVTRPVTFGLIVAYCVCLGEALAALAYGLIENDSVWTRWGAILVASMIIFGIAAFLVRAFLNDVRERSLITSAHRMRINNSGAPVPDLPDPFQDHFLLSCPMHPLSAEIEVTDNQGLLVYTVQTGLRGRVSAIKDDDGKEIARVHAGARGGSFSLDWGQPNKLSVEKGEQEFARVRSRFNWAARVRIIDLIGAPQKLLLLRNETIYAGERIVGRMYDLRGRRYLDIEQGYFNEGLLAAFVLG